MTVNVTDIPFVKIAAVVLTIWFGYLMAETFIISRVRRATYTGRVENTLKQCNTKLGQAQTALTQALSKKK